MTDRSAFPKPHDEAGRATAEEGVVILDGPDGVAVTMTADAAERTADSLREAARQAREAPLDGKPEAGDSQRSDGGSP